MPRTYTTEGSEPLDLICLKAYPGRQEGVVERVLEANSARRIAALMPIIPPNTTIVLPELAAGAQFVRMKTQKLWD